MLGRLPKEGERVMAHFKGTVRGSRGVASRLGSDSLQTTCNGWNSGVTVKATRDEKTFKNTFRVWRNGGSHGRTGSELLAEFTED